MFNIKRTVSLLLAATFTTATLAGCKGAEGENADTQTKAYLMEVDFNQVQEEKNKTTYQTRTLKVESYDLTYMELASPYLQTEPLLLDAPYGNKEFLGYNVKDGDFVKEGDVIMRYRITFDEVDVAQTRLNLQRTTEKFEKYVKSETQRLAEYLAQIAAIPPQDPQFAVLLKDYEKQNEAFKEQQELKQEEIAKLQEKVDWFEFDGQEMTVTAPKDGCVMTERRIWYLGDKTRIGAIYDPHTAYYQIPNNFGRYNFGQSVTAVYEVEKGVERTITGQVITYKKPSSANSQGDSSAILRMELPEDITFSPTQIKANITVLHLDDVIIVPKSAVTAKGKQYYIQYLTDRGVERRYIDVVIESAQEYVIMDTSLAGLRVILN